MNVSDKGLYAIQDNVGQGTDDPRTFRQEIIAAVVGLAVLLVGGVSWLRLGAGPAQGAAAQPQAEAKAEPATIDYFPAQHVNQAKEVEEHIPAF